MPIHHYALLLAKVVLGISLLSGADCTAEITDVVRQAIDRSLPRIQAGARGSSTERKCFTCHNQAIPIFALAQALKQGFPVDESILEDQLKHTAAHLKRGRKEYAAGRGQGGGVMTAGYALWALSAGQQQADEMTAAVTHFLLENQKTSNRWRQASNRPPTSGSDFTTTYVALRGLTSYGTKEQKSAIALRIERASEWILKQKPIETEDRVFRLLTMPIIQAEPQTLETAVSALLDSQREDGGWGQLENTESDAYATATALFALQLAGKLGRNHPSIQGGIQFLLRNQLADGTWHVVSRAIPFQTYFESGFPHGNDQFLSIAASSWATLALLLSLSPQ